MKIPGKEALINLFKPRTLIMIGILLLIISMGLLVDKWKAPKNGIRLNENEELFSPNTVCEKNNKCVLQYLHDDYKGIIVENEIK